MPTPKRPLISKQFRAWRMHLVGMTYEQVGREMNAHRNTVSAWCKEFERQVEQDDIHIAVEYLAYIRAKLRLSIAKDDFPSARAANAELIAIQERMGVSTDPHAQRRKSIADAYLDDVESI